MKLKIVSIGNSRGIRLPKPLMAQVGIENEVEVEVEGNTLILRSPKKGARKGWEKAFKAMAENQDDRLLSERAW